MKKALWRHLRYAQKALVLTIVLGILGAIVTIVQMVFLSKIVDRVFLAHQNVAQVEFLLFFLLIAIIVRAGLVWVREVAAQRAAVRVKSELREHLFAHLLRLGPAYSKGERTGELVATISEGIERLDAYVSRYLPQMALSVLVPLLIVAFILPLDWSSAVLLLVTGPIIPLLMVLVGSYAERHIQRQWVALSRMSAHFLDVVQGLPTLLLFGRSNAQRERVAKVSERFRERTMSVLRIAFLSGGVLEFLTAIAIGLVAVTLGVRLLNHGISFEQAFLVLLLAPEFYQPLRELGVHRHAAIEGNAAAKRIVEILETPVPIHTGTESFKSLNSQLTIEFTDVTYTYPGNDHPALKGIHLTLPADTCTALVGRSGAGKSTLTNLLLRFMDVQNGKIIANGIPLTELSVEEWRQYVALVPQRPYLFSGSVRTNIRLARPDASDDEVIRAAELARATEFITRLPQGYETQIGERGVRLSAGQVQRIAIARAFLKDAPLLVLDEPTSSLDPESEMFIRQALERLMQNRTVLVIAHRYNTISHAQQIAVLEDGQLVEIGQPAALAQINGPYSRFIDACRKV
ncbi:MAG TPA: thiol reductant ABC exporter subunit CydD [Ktedonobacteraceae bacterium]|nr:thiol reductant ABC exporter subunit CydD [Ktedonobacteraceae bacterium]